MHVESRGMQLVIFGVILIIIAAAFAVPVLRYGDGLVDDAGAVVLAASILSLGLGTLNLAFLIVHLLTEEFVAHALLIGLAPIAAGLLGAYVVKQRTHGVRRLLLVGSAVLVLAGAPVYLAFTFAVFAALVAAVLYLVGLTSPRKLMETLDPRN